MTILLLLIAVSLGIATLFLAGFIWAVKSGQFEDTYTPCLRVLTDDQALTRSQQERVSAEQNERS